MSDTKIPVKKLIDSSGKYYYPLSTTESVVTGEGITVKNTIGSYNPDDVIPEKTSLKTILFRILTDTGEADAILHLSNVDVTELSSKTTRVPSSPLVAGCLQKLEDKIKKELIKVAHYRGSVNYYKDLPSATALVGDIYNVRYRGTSGKQEDGNNYIFDDSNRTWDKLSGFADLGDFYTKSEMDTKLSNLKIYIDDQDNSIKNLYVKKSDATGTVSAETGKCITGITQTDGKITSVTSAKLTTDVTVTPLLTSGTHIANITVDTNTVPLYTPANPYTSGVIETWRSGYNWYRLYSDGWIEQGGIATSDGASKSVIIPFHKTMKDAYCSVQVTQDDATGSDTIVPFKKIHNQSRIVVSWNSNYESTFQWECKGYTPSEPVSYYTVTFNANGGTSTESTRSVIANTAIGALPTASKTDYTFTGWFSESSGGFRITPTTVISSNATFYAHYSINTCKITFNANGGVTPETERTIDVGSQIGTLPVPTWENHTFLGWYTQETGGNKIEPTSTFSVNTQLYAHWIVDVVTITFDPNGGTVSETTRTIVKNSAIGILPVPTREDYQFNGWYTSKTGGTKIEITTTFASNSTVYAHWVINTVTVTFDPNGGTVSETTRTVDKGSEIGTLPIPTYSGYEFTGWFTQLEGGTKILETTIVNSNSTYYAHWSEISQDDLLCLEEDHSKLIVTEDLVYNINVGVSTEPILATEIDHDPVETEDGLNNISLRDSADPILSTEIIKDEVNTEDYFNKIKT